jgi:hypothetical protein
MQDRRGLGAPLVFVQHQSRHEVRGNHSHQHLSLARRIL